MNILVTGANGYIGTHVVETLLAMGHNVLASDVFNNNIPSKAKYYSYDILNNPEHKNMWEYFSHPDALIHLAWSDGFNHYAPSHMSNLMKHFSFLNGFIEAGCPSISVMGTAHEVGYHEGKITENTPCNPLSYYGIAKNTLRQLIFVAIKGSKTSLKWLRAYYITGDDKNNHSVFTKILEAAQEGKAEFPFTKGTNQFDFIDVHQLSQQIALASIQNNVEGIINVCSGEPVSLKDKAEEFIKKKGLSIQLKCGVFPQRQYDSPVVYGDNTKIKEIIQNAQ